MRYFPLARGFFIASPFGPRTGGFHAGTDFGWPGGSAGQPVYACQSGTVLYAGAASGYGGPDPAGWLVIDSTDAEGGGCAEYGHLVREVSVGDHVQAGQRIARINPDTNTNGGVAPHCHLSVMPAGYDPNTKIDPLPWLGQAAYPAEQQQPTGGTVSAPLSITQGMGSNPNGSQLIDSDQGISAAAVKAAGYRGRQWYLARPNGGAAGGSLTPGRWHEYDAAGLEQGLNYERDTGDWMADGYQAGVDAGHWIADRVAELRAGGVQGIRYVHLSADSHFNDPNALARVLDCLRGAQSVIGPMARAGYGFVEFIDAARNAGLVDVTWQCGSKSDLRPGVQVYQRNNDNDTIAGVTVDCNDVMAPDWGQINPNQTAPKPKVADVEQPQIDQLNRIEALLAQGIGLDTAANPPTFDGKEWSGSPRQIATVARMQAELAATRAADCSRKLDAVLAALASAPAATNSGAAVDVTAALKAALTSLTLKASN